VLHLLIRYRPVIEGRRNIPAHGPVILASNHLSAIDTAVIGDRGPAAGGIPG